MKTTHTLAFACVALLCADASHAQTTAMTMASIRDNPGTLGHRYADFNYSWVDFHRDAGIDADGYIAGLSAHAPIASGLDAGLGYDYYRENHHRNPFNNASYDTRYHRVATDATFYAPTGPMKPFFTGSLGYQWARGDLQRLRTYDHDWTWDASAGAQVALGLFSLTPRVGYNDVMRGGNHGMWHYGAEAHHWFTEKVGGYLDATFHDPRHGSADWWSYTAGMRLRF